jgi:hypothetical protein
MLVAVYRYILCMVVYCASLKDAYGMQMNESSTEAKANYEKYKNRQLTLQDFLFYCSPIRNECRC